MAVEPIPGEPAAAVDCDGRTVLLVADYHAGIEIAFRREGMELDSRAESRRNRLLALLAETDPDRLVVLGDLAHAIGDPRRVEREELLTLLETVTDRVPITLVKGNHDGTIESVVAESDADVTVTPSTGTRIGDVGFAHGHTWPAREVLTGEYLCLGHEHPEVRLDDEVGGHRVERVWLRGALSSRPFREHFGDPSFETEANLIVCPAYNERSGGTWINVSGQDFLCPFLPEGLDGGEAYLLDGTRLGPFRSI